MKTKHISIGDKVTFNHKGEQEKLSKQWDCSVWTINGLNGMSFTVTSFNEKTKSFDIQNRFGSTIKDVNEKYLEKLT